MELIQQSDGRKSRGVLLDQQRSEDLPGRFLLIVAAYLSLIRFDLCLASKDFGALYNKVRSYQTRKTPASPGSTEAICSAVDMACIWYYKEALCLQRSAATVCLLRKYGIAAQLVIGAQQMPFKAHAWAEVDGSVVNDKQYIGELYATLDRC